MVYRTDINAPTFFWLSERSDEKLHARELSKNQSILRFDVIPQPDWPIKQCLPILGFSLTGKQRGHVLIFLSIG